MKITEKKTKAASGGVPLMQWDLANSHGTQISVINLGATLTSVKFANKKKRIDEITAAFDNPAEYLKAHPFFGCVVGRYGNRIGKSKFSIDGKEYKLVANEGKNQLHGGPGGLHKAMFAGFASEERSQASVTLTYFSPDGDQGYPGNLMIQVTYTLNEKNELIMNYRAVSDKKTPVNLTNHAYWNLNGRPMFCTKVHTVQINADYLVEVDKESIPTGKLLDVRGTQWDLNKPRQLSSVIEETGGVDHCYVVRGEGLRLAARIHDTESGRVMDVLTDQKGIQFYTGNFLSKVRVAAGKIYDKHNAFCLETQNFPDAPNQPEFPDSILLPGREYTHTTIHRFYTK